MSPSGRLLIVDDEELLARQLQKYLSRQGFTVEMATSALAALEILKNQTFDLLVTDLNMPAVGGIELIKRAKDLYPQLQYIIVSANKSPEIYELALSMGIAGFLYKPLSLDELLDAIDRGLATAG